MADITMTMSAETAKLVNGFMAIENKQKALEARQKSLAKSSEHGSRRASQGMDGWAKSIAGVVSGYLSTAAVLATVAKALHAVNEERERAADLAKGAAEGLGPLAQLAGTPKELRALKREAFASMRESGMPAQAAGALQFALTSAGKGRSRSTYARLYGIADPAQMLEAVATLQGSMGTRETGGDRQILDKLFLASAGTKSTVTDLASAAAAAGKTAGMVGTTDEELLAALAVMGRGDESASVVGTQIESLAAAAAKRGLGGGLMNIVGQIQGKRMSGRALFKFLGRKEAVKGYLALSQNAPAVREMQAELQAADAAAAAGTGDYTGQRVGAYRDVFGGVVAERRARAGAEIEAMEAIGGPALSRQTVIEQIRSQSISEGEWAHLRWLRMTQAKSAAWLGMSPESIQWMSDVSRLSGPIGQGVFAPLGLAPRVQGDAPGIGIDVTVRDKRSRAGQVNAHQE